MDLHNLLTEDLNPTEESVVHTLFGLKDQCAKPEPVQPVRSVQPVVAEPMTPTYAQPLAYKLQAEAPPMPAQSLACYAQPVHAQYIDHTPPDRNDNYYYKNYRPGEVPKKGAWSQEETIHFLTQLRHKGSETWGAFSARIAGRNGEQCNGYYRYLVKAGKIQPLPNQGKKRRRSYKRRKASPPQSPVAQHHAAAPLAVYHKYGDAAPQHMGRLATSVSPDANPRPLTYARTAPAAAAQGTGMVTPMTPTAVTFVPNKAEWSMMEVERFVTAVLHKPATQSWPEFAQHFPGRTGAQCGDLFRKRLLAAGHVEVRNGLVYLTPQGRAAHQQLQHDIFMQGHMRCTSCHQWFAAAVSPPPSMSFTCSTCALNKVPVAQPTGAAVHSTTAAE